MFVLVMMVLSKPMVLLEIFSKPDLPNVQGKGGFAQGVCMGHADIHGIVEPVGGNVIESNQVIAHVHMAVVVDPLRFHFGVGSEQLGVRHGDLP